MHSGGYIGIGFGSMNAMSMLGAMMGSFSYGGNMGWFADAMDVAYNAGNRSLIYDGYSGFHSGRFGSSVGQCMRNITRIAQSIDTMFADKGGNKRTNQATDATTPPANQPAPAETKSTDKKQNTKGTKGIDDSEEAKETKAKKKAADAQRETSREKARSQLHTLGYDDGDKKRIIKGIEAKLAKDGNTNSAKAIKKAYEDGVKCWKLRSKTVDVRDKKGKPISIKQWNKKWAYESGEAWLRFQGVEKERAKALVKPLVQKRISTTKKPLNYMYLKRETPDGKYEVFTFVKGVGDAEEFKGKKVYKKGKRWYTLDGTKYKYIKGSNKWHRMKSDDPTISEVMVNLNGKKHPWTDQLTTLGKSYSADKLIARIEKAANIDSDSDDGTVTGPIRTVGPCTVRVYDSDKKEIKVAYDALKERVEKYIEARKKEFEAKKSGAGKIRLVLLFKKGMEPKVDKDDDPFKKLKGHLEKKYGAKFEIVTRNVDTVHYTVDQRGQIRDLVFMRTWDGTADGTVMDTCLDKANDQITFYHKTSKLKLPYPFEDGLRKCKEKFLAHAKAMHKKWKAKEITLDQYKTWFEDNGSTLGSWKVPGARKIFEKHFPDKIAEFEWKKPAPKKKPKKGGGGGGGSVYS